MAENRTNPAAGQCGGVQDDPATNADPSGDSEARYSGQVHLSHTAYLAGEAQRVLLAVTDATAW